MNNIDISEDFVEITPDQFLRETIEKLEPVMGKAPEVSRFEHQFPDDDSTYTVDIIRAVDNPNVGLSTWMSVGLSRFDSGVAAEDGRPIRSELVVAGRSSDQVWAEVLNVCCRVVIGGAAHTGLNAIFPAALSHITENITCKHVVCISPFVWPELPVVESEDDLIRTRLQLIAITDSELAYASTHSVDDLMALFDEKQPDISDLNRANVV